MVNKGQVSTMFVFLLIFIIGGFLIVFGYDRLNDIRQAGQTAELENFKITLSNQVENQKQKSFGSVDVVSLSLPPGVQRVCFIDEQETFSPHTILELRQQKDLYQDRNVFFFPLDKFTPARINSLALGENNANPLCVQAVSGRVNLRLTTLARQTKIEAAKEQEIQQDCVSIRTNLGDPEDKVDIVFLGYGYTNGLAADVNDYINEYLFKVEPFKNSEELFNIWMADGEPECTITSYIWCDSFSVNTLASNCPNDYVFVLVDDSVVGRTIRSSSIGNLAKINTRDNELVLVHEFGHTFGDLADEYEDEDSYGDWFDAKNFANCDVAGCPSWSSVPDTGCFEDCSTKAFYRSTDKSIMRDYGQSDQFGPVSENELSTKLEVYS